MAATKLSLKLLVDKEKNRVVFAESEMDFVDVLLSFLTLPVGTVVRVLDKQSQLGCMDRLYESVEKLDVRFMETKACRSMLLHPRSAATDACEDLKISIDDTKPRSFYRCRTYECCTKTSRLYSEAQHAKCPCGLTMDVEETWTKSGTKKDGVFVKWEGNFTISDNLHVGPTSTDATLSVLQGFGVNISTVLEEMNVDVGKEEMLNLLKRSLISEMPLTDVFLCKLDVCRDADMLERDQTPSTVKCEEATDTKRPRMKLVLSKSRNTVLYAEAGGDVVDFLFSILTFPVGSIIKLLDRCSSMGCVDNLYKSIVKLSDTDSLVHPNECTTMLVSPKLAAKYACASQLLCIQEEVSSTLSVPGCQNCFSQGSTGTGAVCTHGIEHVTLSLLNPKLPSLGTKSGGGFTKGHQVFMITDELEVTPLSSVSSIHTVSRLGIPISDLVTREVSLGEAEALKILKASLISRRVLSNVFCHRKRKYSPS